MALTPSRSPLVTLPTPTPAYSVEDQSQLRRLIAAALSTIPGEGIAPLVPYINAEDYGVVGDGTTDDTTAMQAALTAGGTLNRAVYAGSLTVTTTVPATETAGAFTVGIGYTIVTVGTTDFTLIGASANTVGVHFIATGVGTGTGTAKPAALTMSGPGLIFDRVPHGSSGGPGIKVTGTGYTALMVTGNPQYVQAAVYHGTPGTAANGVVFQNPLLAVVQNIRAYGFNGWGVKINKCWDCVFGSISVEACGNATDYAFSMNADGDTCNMSHILRLQVEASTTKAIYVDLTCLNCYIDNIHSEGLLSPNASYFAWLLGGARGGFRGARFNSTGTTSNAKLKLYGETEEYTDLNTEDSIAVEIEAFSGTSVTVVNPKFNGALSLTTNQTGQVTMLGGYVYNLATAFIRDTGAGGPARIFGAYGTRFGTVAVGDCMNPPNTDMAMFVGCAIGTLSSSSALSAATFLDCSIASAGNALQGMTIFHGGIITVGTMQAAGPLKAYGTRFVGNITYTGYELFDPGCSCTGTVTGATAPTQGTWIAGELTKLLSIGTLYRCTVAGTPGTWVLGAGSGALSTLTLGSGLSGTSYDGSAPITAAVTSAPILGTARTISGVSFDGSANIDVETSSTWTPSLKFGGAAVGMTYAAQSGTYVKVGKYCLVTCDFTLSAMGSSTGAATITGLPFTVSETAPVMLGYYAAMAGFAGYQIIGRADSGGTTIVLSIVDADAAPTQLGDTWFTANSRLILSCVYHTT